MNATCVECDYPLRPQGTTLADHPGTRTLQGRGLCQRCYQHAWRAGQIAEARNAETAAEGGMWTNAPAGHVYLPTFHNYAPPPAWTEQALCAQTDPDSFFPDKGGSTRAALTTCAQCPVTLQCLEYALDNDERFGIWGGVTERKRHEMRKERRQG